MQWRTGPHAPSPGGSIPRSVPCRLPPAAHIETPVSTISPPRTSAARLTNAPLSNTRPPLAAKASPTAFSIRFFNALTSNDTSTYIRFNFAFFSSNSRKRLISAAVIPPYFDFRLKYVDSQIPSSRQTSATVRPVSIAFNIPKTCLSLNSYSAPFSFSWRILFRAEYPTYP